VCSSSAPDIGGRIFGGASDLGIAITPYCSNGLPTADPVNFCSDNPPLIAGFNVRAASDAPGSTPVTQWFPASTVAAGCALRGAAVECMLPSVQVPPYARVNVSVTTQYADQSSSVVGQYPTRFSPSPYVTPQTIYDLYGVPRNTRATNPANSQSVTAFELQYIDVAGTISTYDWGLLLYSVWLMLCTAVAAVIAGLA